MERTGERFGAGDGHQALHRQDRRHADHDQLQSKTSKGIGWAMGDDLANGEKHQPQVSFLSREHLGRVRLTGPLNRLSGPARKRTVRSPMRPCATKRRTWYPLFQFDLQSCLSYRRGHESDLQLSAVQTSDGLPDDLPLAFYVQPG